MQTIKVLFGTILKSGDKLDCIEIAE